MKLGIVGTGTIVEEVLPVLQQVKGLSCYGICGTKRSEAKAEKLKEQYQMQLAVSDYEKLLDSEIDTVYIAVPNLLHFEMAKEAVLCGKHVIVEKPMTANERQAEELCALAKKQGVFLFEAITTRYQSNYQFIKEQLPTIGKIKMAVCNFSQYSRKYDRFQNGENIPVFDAKQAGGALMDLNLYNIQYLEGLFGEPQSVHYTANMEKGIDTSGVAILSYPGFQAVAIGAKDCQGQPEYRIEGSEGYIAQNMEKKGMIADRCEINRRVRADNRILRELKTQIKKLVQAVEKSIPVIAETLEAIRNHMIFTQYHLLHNEMQKEVIHDWMNHFNPILNKYNTVKKKLKAKVTERKELNVEKEKTSILNPIFSPIVHGNLNIRGNRNCKKNILFNPGKNRTTQNYNV